MDLLGDIARIEEELAIFSANDKQPTRTQLYTNLLILKQLLNSGGGQSLAGRFLSGAREVEYLDSDIFTLTVPVEANYAELYFEASDYDDNRRVARVTIGESDPTIGTGLAQYGRYARNEDVLIYTKRDELTRLKIKKLAATTNLRVEVNYYA